MSTNPENTHTSPVTCERDARVNLLEMQVVEVRTPLVYGSIADFFSVPEDADGMLNPSDLREAIDTAATPTEQKP